MLIYRPVLVLQTVANKLISGGFPRLQTTEKAIVTVVYGNPVRGSAAQCAKPEIVDEVGGVCESESEHSRPHQKLIPRNVLFKERYRRKIVFLVSVLPNLMRDTTKAARSAAYSGIIYTV